LKIVLNPPQDRSLGNGDPPIMITRSRELSLKLVYQLTHKMVICRSKCRPLNRSSIGLNDCIPHHHPVKARLHQSPDRIVDHIADDVDQVVFWQPIPQAPETPDPEGTAGRSCP